MTTLLLIGNVRLPSDGDAGIDADAIPLDNNVSFTLKHPPLVPGYPPTAQRSGRDDLGGGTCTPPQLRPQKLWGPDPPPAQASKAVGPDPPPAQASKDAPSNATAWAMAGFPFVFGTAGLDSFVSWVR